MFVFFWFTILLSLVYHALQRCTELTEIKVCKIVKVLHNSQWLVVIVTLFLYSSILRLKFRAIYSIAQRNVYTMYILENVDSDTRH